MPRSSAVASPWGDALADLDEHLTSAELAFERDPSGVIPKWQPPTDLGPLPLELSEKAQLLFERHQTLLQSLSEAAQSLHHELEFLESATGISEARTSSYLDARL